MRRVVTAAALLAFAAGGCSAINPSATVTPGDVAVTSPASGASSGTGEPTATGSPLPTGTATTTTTPPSPSPSPAELPGGGRRVLPQHRLVGFSGAPSSEAFGRLGVGDLDDRARQIKRLSRDYDGDRDVLPVFELITVVALADAGSDGQYRSRLGDDEVRRYLAAARRAGALLLLNIQPGLSEFLPEVRAYERWLREPDVGVALDPEWAVEPGQVPGETYGTTTGAELDRVAAYLAKLVRRHDLPQKVMVFHQVAASVVTQEGAIQRRPEVAVIKSVDGIGSPDLKVATWRVLTRDLPPPVHAGFKLFFEEDARSGDLMTPRQVLALRPKPEYVLYE